ncbi:MAG: hypothetical protein ACE5EC_10625 [Phycisphaerae bacterium]
MNRRIVLACLLGCVWMLTGCGYNAASARRIELRRARFQRTWAALEKREATAPARMENNRRSLERWWRSDVRNFNARIPLIGDYLW